jgi:20S proteasome alpha/beta subunit
MEHPHIPCHSVPTAESAKPGEGTGAIVTVGIVVRCEDGIVIASDSLATFSRGAPVARQTNKVYTIEHDELAYPVALIGAGMTAFIDKFVDRAKRDGITEASTRLGRKLDIIDFVDRVGETLTTILLKEYVVDRNKFFGAPIGDYSLAMLVAGATVDKELRAYHIHTQGVSESIEGYGTTGSGAAYAELFLHGFIPDPAHTSIKDAVRLVAYAIKGVEIMDPTWVETPVSPR